MNSLGKFLQVFRMTYKTSSHSILECVGEFLRLCVCASMRCMLVAIREKRTVQPFENWSRIRWRNVVQNQ